jgi:hypothetical protein
VVPSRPPSEKQSAPHESKVTTETLIQQLLAEFRVSLWWEAERGHEQYSAPDPAENGARYRRGFTRHVDTWCRNIPGFLVWLAQELCEIYPNVGAVETELDKAVSLLKREIEEYPPLFCDSATLASSWRAPGVLEPWPEGLSHTSRSSVVYPERLDAADTEEFLERFQEYVSPLFDKAKPLALKTAVHLCAKQPTRTVADASAGFSLREGYRTIRFAGKSHSLTRQQADILRILHEAYLASMPDVSEDDIFARLGRTRRSRDNRLRDSFRSRNAKLLGTLIVKGQGPATYRLNLFLPPEQNGS